MRAAHRVLRLALNTAVEDGKLAKNPAVAKRMVPRAAHTERRVLSPAEVCHLLTTTRDDRLGPLWNVLALTGARPGEALGLHWADLDLKAGEASIQRALVPAAGRERAGVAPGAAEDHALAPGDRAGPGHGGGRRR